MEELSCKGPLTHKRVYPRRVIIAGLIFSLFCGIAFCVQYGGLRAPMYYDSVGSIESKRHVFRHEGLSGVLTLFPQRPLPVATFYVNFLLGDMEPMYFRVLNIMLLGATGLVVVLLLRLILGVPGPWNRGGPDEQWLVSLLLGLVFLVHPLQTYVTLYIWQRTALMACLFSYAALAAYVATRAGRIENRAIGYGLCAVSFVAAMLSKENAATLPAVLVLIDVGLFRDRWRQVFLRAVVYFAILAVIVGTLSFIQHPHGRPEMGSGILTTIVQYAHEGGHSPADLAFTQCRVLFQYLAVIVAPIPSSVQLISPQVMSTSLLVPRTTIFAVAGVIGLVGLGLVCLRKRPLTGVGILFFVGNLVPEGILVPQYAYCGYRAVLPMLGVLLVVADWALVVIDVARSAPGLRLLRAGVVAVLVAASILLGMVTTIRAGIWGNEVRFWQDMVDSFLAADDQLEQRAAAHALGNLGVALYKAGFYGEAVDYLERATRLESADGKKLASLAAAYAELGNVDKAQAILEQAISVDPDCAPTYHNLGVVLLKRKRIPEAVDRFRKALSLAAFDPSLHHALGEALLAQRDLAGAADSFRRAVELNPRAHFSFYQLGQILLATGKPAEAVSYFRRAILARPDYWEAYNSMGIAYAHAGRNEDAVQSFRHALALNPENAQIRMNLDTALRQIRGKQ